MNQVLELVIIYQSPRVMVPVIVAKLLQLKGYNFKNKKVLNNKTGK